MPGEDDLVVLVDYAHTPDALERVLGSVRSFTDGKVWCVFGCGGDRDRAKRRPMGAAVARAADVAILTNDNPRSEDPLQIANAVIEGLEQGTARYDVELDRGRAIERAVAEAAAGDVVLVAGKGGGSILTGRHMRCPAETPMSNLFLSMLDRMGVQADRFGDSAGRLRGLEG